MICTVHWPRLGLLQGDAHHLSARCQIKCALNAKHIILRCTRCQTFKTIDVCYIRRPCLRLRHRGEWWELAELEYANACLDDFLTYSSTKQLLPVFPMQHASAPHLSASSSPTMIATTSTVTEATFSIPRFLACRVLKSHRGFLGALRK